MVSVSPVLRLCKSALLRLLKGMQPLILLKRIDIRFAQIFFVKEGFYVHYSHEPDAIPIYEGDLELWRGSGASIEPDTSVHKYTESLQGKIRCYIRVPHLGLACFAVDIIWTN